MEIKAYKCKYCGTIHEQKTKHTACERACKKEKEEDDHEKILQKTRGDILNYPRLNATSIPHLIELSKAAAKQMWDVDLNFTLDVRYDDSISNSHNAPIGKPTNWERKSNLPTHYEGLTGWIKGTSKVIKVKKFGNGWRRSNSEMSGSDFFAGSFSSGIAGICIGSGGGGQPFGYDVKLFLDDFPLIKAKMHEEFRRKKILDDYCAGVRASTTSVIAEDENSKVYDAQMLDLRNQIAGLQNILGGLQNNKNLYLDKKFWKDANKLISDAQEKHQQWKDGKTI